MAGPDFALAPALADLLARSGARAVRLVDGRTGRVVGSAGDPATGGADDLATVAGLVRDAVALGQGGLDDVVVTTDRSMHVLRPGPVPGVFLHLRLGLDRADVVRARHALAAPALHAAVRAALATGADGPDPDARPPVGEVADGGGSAGPAADVPNPAPRVPGPRAHPAGARRAPRPVTGGRSADAPPAARAGSRIPAQQPALAGLVVERAPAGNGTRAAGVLAELIELSPTDRSLPRRRPAPAARPVRPSGAHTVGLPDRAWARDVDTMRRLVLGLRRLN